MKINLDNAVIIKENKIDKFAFVPITKEEYAYFDDMNSAYHAGKLKLKDFINLFGHNPMAFILHGETEDVTSELVANYIDCCGVKESENKQPRNSYKCFCGEPYNLDYTKTVLHGTPYDAWLCLMTKLNNPKYGMVINLRYV